MLGNGVIWRRRSVGTRGGSRTIPAGCGVGGGVFCCTGGLAGRGSFLAMGLRKYRFGQVGQNASAVQAAEPAVGLIIDDNRAALELLAALRAAPALGRTAPVNHATTRRPPLPRSA